MQGYHSFICASIINLAQMLQTVKCKKTNKKKKKLCENCLAMILSFWRLHLKCMTLAKVNEDTTEVKGSCKGKVCGMQIFTFKVGDANFCTDFILISFTSDIITHSI